LYTAQIKITLRKSILDPQGKTVEHSVQSLGYRNIKNTRIGKYVELEIDASSQEEANRITDEICRKLLANPVMEDYTFQITEQSEAEVEQS